MTGDSYSCTREMPWTPYLMECKKRKGAPKDAVLARSSADGSHVFPVPPGPGARGKRRANVWKYLQRGFQGGACFLEKIDRLIDYPHGAWPMVGSVRFRRFENRPLLCVDYVPYLPYALQPGCFLPSCRWSRMQEPSASLGDLKVHMSHGQKWAGFINRF